MLLSAGTSWNEPQIVVLYALERKNSGPSRKLADQLSSIIFAPLFVSPGPFSDVAERNPNKYFEFLFFYFNRLKIYQKT